jgi:hypothetical protein
MGFGVEMFEEFEGFTFIVPYFWFLVLGSLPGGTTQHLV